MQIHRRAAKQTKVRYIETVACLPIALVLLVSGQLVLVVLSLLVALAGVVCGHIALHKRAKYGLAYPRKTRAIVALGGCYVLVIAWLTLAVIGFRRARAGMARIRVAAAVAQMQAFEVALQRYRMDHGSIPDQHHGLQSLVEMPDGLEDPACYRRDGYLDTREVPRDPWGSEYVYLVPGPDGGPFEILSYGSDGEPGGVEEAADIEYSWMVKRR